MSSILNHHWPSSIEISNIFETTISNIHNQQQTQSIGANLWNCSTPFQTSSLGDDRLCRNWKEKYFDLAWLSEYWIYSVGPTLKLDIGLWKFNLIDWITFNCRLKSEAQDVGIFYTEKGKHKASLHSHCYLLFIINLFYHHCSYILTYNHVFDSVVLSLQWESNYSVVLVMRLSRPIHQRTEQVLGAANQRRALPANVRVSSATIVSLQ